MEMKLDIPAFISDEGIRYNWEPNFEIEARIKDGSICITANKAGLISFANHFLNLAQDGVPTGHHLHFDAHNSLEDGSSEMIIEKKL